MPAESGHWTPVTASEAEEDMWVETDPEMLWQQQVDDRIWVFSRKSGVTFLAVHMTISLRT